MQISLVERTWVSPASVTGDEGDVPRRAKIAVVGPM